MEGFRWILGLVGLALVVGVLIYSRRTNDNDADMPFEADDYGHDSLDEIFFDKPVPPEQASNKPTATDTDTAKGLDDLPEIKITANADDELPEVITLEDLEPTDSTPNLNVDNTPSFSVPPQTTQDSPLSIGDEELPSIFMPDTNEPNVSTEIDAAQPLEEPVYMEKTSISDTEPASLESPAIAESDDMAVKTDDEELHPSTEENSSQVSDTSTIEEVHAPESPPVSTENKQPVTSNIDDVLVLYLVSNDLKGMTGLRIQAQTKALGFVYSELGMFQYRLHGRLLFSLMNAMAPGRIDRDDLENLRTRALTIFIQLPIEEEPYYTLDKMVEMTHNLARRLNAVALDSERRPLTMNSVDKMREIVNKHVNTHADE